MTAWFDLCGLLLIGVGDAIIVRLLLHRAALAHLRREIQLFVLASPVIGLFLGWTRLAVCSGVLCVSGAGASGWADKLGYALAVGMEAVAVGALGLGLVRLILIPLVVIRGTLPAGPDLQAVADRLAGRVGSARARVRIRFSNQPVALTIGMWRPVVLISTWMLDHLDELELEAVLAHELGHIARRDTLVVWLATTLRDAFFYLPASREAYRQLHHDKEIACDDLAVMATRCPLDLASALAKVWQRALSGGIALTPLSPAQLLVTASDLVEGRITRLLELTNPAAAIAPRRPLPSSAATVVASLVLGAGCVIALLTLMGCGLAGHGVTAIAI